MPGDAQQPAAHHGDAGLDGIYQRRQHPGQSAQLPQQEGPQKQRHHSNAGEGQAHPDTGAETSGQPGFFPQKGHPRLRGQSQRSAKEEGKNQGQQKGHGQPRGGCHENQSKQSLEVHEAQGNTSRVDSDPRT